MATASDYSVSFPYGATSAPYSPSRPHRGNDRPCPTGTPVVIGSTTIGLTGATGYTFGAHLHIQEWSGSYANTRKPRNEFKGGKVINVDLNGTQGDGSFGKFISIQTSDGWVDSYCHLSKINVKVGQVISGTATGGNDVFETDAEVAEAYKLLRGNSGTAAERKSWIGQPKQRFFQVGLAEANAVRAAKASAEAKVKSLTTDVNSLKDTVSQLKTQVASVTNKVGELTNVIKIKDDEIAKLKAEVAAGGNGEDSVQLNALGAALRWLITRLGLKG